MQYLLWRARLKQYFLDNLSLEESVWESWAIWRELYLKSYSPQKAAEETYSANLAEQDSL